MSVLLALQAGGPTNLTAVAGVVTIAGGTATLAYSAPATAGTITVAGGVATLRTSQSATAGTVTIAGGAATLAVAVNATAGTVTVAGGTATIRVTIPALAGLVEIQGGTATITSGGAATNLSASAGTIDIAGGAAALEVRAPATAGTVTIAGGTATLQVATVLVAEAGTIAVSGGDATLQATDHRQLAAEAGTIAIEGGTAALEGGGDTQGGGVSWVGEIVPLRQVFPEIRELAGRATIRVHAEATMGVRRASRARVAHHATTMAVAGRVRAQFRSNLHAGPRVAGRVGKRAQALTTPLFVRDRARATVGARRGTRARSMICLDRNATVSRRAGVTGRLNLTTGDKTNGRLLTRASASG